MEGGDGDDGSDGGVQRRRCITSTGVKGATRGIVRLDWSRRRVEGEAGEVGPWGKTDIIGEGGENGECRGCLTVS